jgi:hypothetical protein
MPPVTEDLAFPILGRSFVGHGVPEPLRGWLLEQWWRPEHSLPARRFAIGLEWTASDSASAPAQGEPVRALVPGGVLTWRSSGGQWEWRGDGATGVRLTLEPEQARIHVWGTSARDAELFTALYIAICEALRASGLLPLHAAVAAPPGGTVAWRPPAPPSTPGDPAAAAPAAMAFLGGRGAGKSTTLLHFARAGWTPVAEDLCWIDPDARVLYGWDRGVRLQRAAIEAFFPELSGAPWVAEPDGKLLIRYDDLACHGLASGGPGGGGRGASEAARRGTLAGVTLLHRAAGGGSGWDPLPARDAVRALWEAVGVPLGAAARQTAAAWIGTVAARLPLYHLRLGKTPPGPPPSW